MVTVLSAVSAVIVIAGVSAGLLVTRGARAQTGLPSGNMFQTSHFYQLGRDDALYSDSNPDDIFAAQAAADAAYPATQVGADQMLGAASAFSTVYGRAHDPSTWKVLGPTTTSSDGNWTYTGVPFGVSGRVTALGVGTTCHAGDCRLYLGAAGGGIWRTDDALANPPVWSSVMTGLSTNAIGSIWVDPHNSSHVLVGTGEPNGSGDSEAGLGLFETTNAGGSWALVPGSFAAAAGRSIGSVVVDPANPQHIFIGTDVARHGSSAVNGGRYTPPNAPEVGLYESTDGGATFSLVFSKASDTVNPGSPTGGDFFRGGVSKIEFDPTTAGRIYFSMFDYGLFRSNGSGGYEQVYTTLFAGNTALSSVNRVEFATAKLSNGKLRIYLGDSRTGTARFYRVDDAGVSAATLTNGVTNPGWTQLSSSTNGTPGYASYNYCSGQCSYDMPVVVSPTNPDEVWIGGQMQYGEFFGRSNGRAIQRSIDAGVDFTDMTNDMQFHGMHPDQHAIAIDPENADIGFFGSDGGLVRTSGQFANMASDAGLGCAARGLNTTSANSVDCQHWLSAVPTLIFNMNAGLATLQFQSVAVNNHNVYDVMGGTQDNGTLFRQGTGTSWSMLVGGDGGQSGINVTNPNIKFHSYYSPAHDVNFHGGDPLEWLWISDPLGNTENASFYVPMIYDPVPLKADTMFEGEQHVWRTTDNGGDQKFLEAYCNEFNYNPPAGTQCGDWKPLGGPEGPGNAGDLTSTLYGPDKTGSYVVAISRAQSNTGTMWVGTRRGRLYVTTNADAANPADVTFTRIDTPSTPTRFISGIAVDPNDPNHAFVSFSGYDAYATKAGTATGHVFEVRFNGTSATWTDMSADLGDQPITAIAYDAFNGDVYVGTDFGVLRWAGHSKWVPAGNGLPLVAVYGLTLAGSGDHEVLYAATHGRGAFVLDLTGEHTS